MGQFKTPPQRRVELAIALFHSRRAREIALPLDDSVKGRNVRQPRVKGHTCDTRLAVDVNLLDSVLCQQCLFDRLGTAPAGHPFDFNILGFQRPQTARSKDVQYTFQHRVLEFRTSIAANQIVKRSVAQFDR